jgi:hypothetical protein
MVPVEDLLFVCYDDAGRTFIAHKMSDLGGLRSTLYQHGVFFPRHRMICAVWINQIAVRTVMSCFQRKLRDSGFASYFRSELNRAGAVHQPGASIIYSRHDGRAVQYPYIEYANHGGSSGGESFIMVQPDKHPQPDAPYISGVIGHSGYLPAVSSLYFNVPSYPDRMPERFPYGESRSDYRDRSYEYYDYPERF